MKSNGTMVIPFPNHDRNCELVDLSNYKLLFKDLKNSFPKCLSNNSPTNIPNTKQLGSYKVSIANDITELLLVDKKEFEISDDLIEFFKSKYKRNFGAIVCKLDEDKDYHPIGYVHSRPRKKRLFIPTMHYHKHTNESVISSDWDHTIYGMDSRAPTKQFKHHIESESSCGITLPESIEKIDFSKLPIKPPSKCIWKADIHNYSKNHDILISDM
jgi:hypothetical protein